MALQTDNLDYNRPAADLIKEGTARAHAALENSQGAQWLSRGELDKSEYVRYLMMLWLIYKTLEEELDQHSSVPILENSYRPQLLARGPALSLDIGHFLDTASWKLEPGFRSMERNPPLAVQEYVSRLREVSQTNPALLLVHAYVRYFGDLSGGQILKWKIKKAYGLDENRGLAFYQFGAEGSTMGALKRVKEGFKTSMNNSILAEDIQLKKELVMEASRAFELNAGVFEELRRPSGTVGDAAPVVPMVDDVVRLSGGRGMMVLAASVLLVIMIAVYRRS